ncbi:MAG: polysaccharide pyruvyl transferase family protein [Ignavibacteria bacterium]|jgi:hypothetical protein
MKIKTITCHNVYNFGASLQAYALMKYLQKLGNEVEIIDYLPKYLKFSFWAIGSKWDKNLIIRILYFIYVVPKRIMQKKRREKFDKFTRNNLNLTSIKYSSLEGLNKNPPEADLFIAGSDQIWNPDLPNGKDPVFFLEFVKDNSIKASYAASFSVSKIKEEFMPFVKSKLQNFNYISVREKTGLKILNEIGFKNGELVIDPVFLLEKEDWDKIANNISNEKYIFVYDQENNLQIRKTAQRLAKNKNLKIFAIESLYPMSYADNRIKDAGPEDFLGLIKNCEICLTNSFHCISFSLIFHKAFYLFKRKHMNVNSRMLDLLSYLELCNRIGDNLTDSSYSDVINFNKVDKLLKKMNQSSTKFLENIIHDAIVKG